MTLATVEPVSSRAASRLPSDVPPPPRALLVLAGVVLAAGWLMTFVGGWRTGVSWDETFHVARLQNYLDHGWYLLDHDLANGEPGEWADERYVYGPATMLLLHLWAMVWGADGSGEVSATAFAFAVRHLGVGLISVVGVAATAAIARILLRGWGWGLVAAGVLVAVPTWTGHAMFNVKDVPVAVGYTLTTLGVLVVCVRPAGRRGLLVAGCLTVVAGVLLAVGTRPGIWPGVALTLTVGLLTRDRGRILTMAAVVIAAAALLLALYPEAFGTPFTALKDAALSSSRFDGRQGYWWYVPLFLGVELPTLVLLLGAAGAVICVRRLRIPDPTRLAIVLVLLQAFALPGLAVLRESNLYNGLRQLLFATPALAVLVTVAVAATWRWCRARDTRTARALPAVLGLAVVLPVLAQLQLFPYNYAYRSVPAAVLAPAAAEHDRDWELQSDYWRTSVRELAPSIPVGGFVTCTPPIVGDTFLPADAASHDDCATDPIGPLSPYDGHRAGTWPADPTTFLAVDAGTDFVGANCERFADVTRRLYWTTLTMSYVARCDLVLQPYPATGLMFAGDGTGGSVLLGAWQVHRSYPGVGLPDEPAAIGVTLPENLLGTDLVVSGTVTGREGLSLAANGEPLRVSTGAEAFTARVPADVAGAYGEGRLLIRLDDRDPTDLRLLTLRIEAAR